jgi:hypothetical protein
LGNKKDRKTGEQVVKGRNAVCPLMYWKGDVKRASPFLLNKEGEKNGSECIRSVDSRGSGDIQLVFYVDDGNGMVRVHGWNIGKNN